MNYQTYQPNNNLKSIVKCYWILEAPKEIRNVKQRIVPDGCMEMIFHYGDRFKQYDETGSFIIQPKCFVFGQITKALNIEPTGVTGMFAVRFYPESFTPFATIPINRMENRAVSLFQLFGEKGLLLEQGIINARTTENRITIVEKFLLANSILPESIDRIVKSSVNEILQCDGQRSIEDLSESLNVSRRQLERKFSSLIGLSPKQLCKVVRLQATLKLLLSKEFASLTSIAYEGDYYDQAHFIKDFKEFTGLSPKQFYANNLEMSVLFSGLD
jgi:AraC-like DNA-binding protein